jgi:hypothetical protein
MLQTSSTEELISHTPGNLRKLSISESSFSLLTTPRQEHFDAKL